MAGPLWVLAIFSLVVGLAFPVLLIGAAFFGALALIVTILQLLGLIPGKPGTRPCPHCQQPVDKADTACPHCEHQLDG